MENTCDIDEQLVNVKGKTGLQKTLDLELVIEGWAKRSVPNVYRANMLGTLRFAQPTKATLRFTEFNSGEC